MLDNLHICSSPRRAGVNMPKRGKDGATIGSVDCIAIVGRGNDLQYFQTFSSQDQQDDANGLQGEEPNPSLFLHMLLFSSLDIVEQRMDATSQTQFYMGMICESDLRKVFCFVTMTGFKFFLVATDEQNVLEKSDNVRRFLENLHQNFINSLCNPFSQGQQHKTNFSGGAQFVPSRGFLKRMEDSVRIAQQWWSQKSGR